jgi:hypothetical protein
MGVGRQKTSIIGNLWYFGKFHQKYYCLMWKCLFITNSVSNYNKNYIIYRFKCMPYLFVIFKIAQYFLLARKLMAFLHHISLFCKCNRWRWSLSLCFSIQFITSLMLSNTLLILGVPSLHISSFLLSSSDKYCSLLQFSVSLANHQSSLIMCKVRLLKVTNETQSFKQSCKGRKK